MMLPHTRLISHKKTNHNLAQQKLATNHQENTIKPKIN